MWSLFFWSLQSSQSDSSKAAIYQSMKMARIIAGCLRRGITPGRNRQLTPGSSRLARSGRRGSPARTGQAMRSFPIPNRRGARFGLRDLRRVKKAKRQNRWHSITCPTRCNGEKRRQKRRFLAAIVPRCSIGLENTSSSPNSRAKSN